MGENSDTPETLADIVTCTSAVSSNEQQKYLPPHKCVMPVYAAHYVKVPRRNLDFRSRHYEQDRGLR